MIVLGLHNLPSLISSKKVVPRSIDWYQGYIFCNPNILVILMIPAAYPRFSQHKNWVTISPSVTVDENLGFFRVGSYTNRASLGE
mmetsp:Transcript_12922/g.16509  ORF Transcript_12922/g.16509 Transcript_12922/m.16509 type:complete len:85 (-) Transcript_12922:190-444(-)